ncbi:MAG: flagellar FliJ family protein [Terriglobales bacterium]|jgi:flagellar export protein FliJ
MPFRFALAPILRLRQSIERQRTLQLQEANLRVSRAQQEVVQLDRFLVSSDQSDSAALAAGRTAAELQFIAVLRKNLIAYREELQSDVRKFEQLRQKALAEYHQAYRDREILEGLRAREREAYQQEQTRRQQQELDAAHLLQRWHRRR